MHWADSDTILGPAAAQLIVFSITQANTIANMTDLRKRIGEILIAIFVVVWGGTAGYYFLFTGKSSFVDCFYMTIISLTTVGYGEVLPVSGNVPAQLFTMFLITFGMGVIIYGISTLTALIIEGEISGIIRKKQMEKQIQKLNGHYIVCGGGETGRHILVELHKNLEKAVLIEIDEERIERCASVGKLLYLHGDATDDQYLITAGIDRAAGIIICLPSDKDNLYITMTARMRNKHIRIISKMVDKRLEPKLRAAGADGVVSPDFIGALRIASEMIRPTAVDFLDSMLRSKKGNLRIHEISVPKGSKLTGKTIKDINLPKRFDVLVLGSREQYGEIEFNPPVTQVLGESTTLIVMGEVDKIAKAKEIF